MTFLWSTSFIIIKIGIVEIPAISFAALRYSLEFLCFIPLFLKKKYISEIRTLSFRQWLKLFFLGIVFYTLTQGTQFIGLSLLPSVTVSLMLNFTPLIVAILGIFLLNEKPTLLQWIGAFLFIIGILAYFSPLSSISGQLIGLIVMVFGVLANADSAIICRNINREKNLSPLVITFISMGIGSIFLLAIGFGQSGVPTISFNNWVFLLWLAIVNTAFAFTLWIFLEESITFQEGIGMTIAANGAVIVQYNRQRREVPSK